MMNIDIRQVAEALERANSRIEHLESRIRQIEENSDYRNLSYIHAVLKRFINTTSIRGFFHTEILRTAGLISPSELKPVEEKARERFVTEPGYGLKPESAHWNLEAVKSELSGEYKSADDLNPLYK